MNVEQLFNQAVAEHQSGRLPAAESLYRRILDETPRHAGALHLLGVIAHQRGNNATAVELITRAIAIEAGDAAYHSNLGVALRADGRRAEAAAAFREAVRLDPRYTAACKNLGVTLNELGRFADAVEPFRKAVELNPGDAGNLKTLGVALSRAGDLDEAAAVLQRAAAAAPGDAETRNNLGVVLKDLGRYAEAETALREAARLSPDNADIHNNLGLVLSNLGRSDEALTAAERAVRARPDSAVMHNNYGVALKEAGRYEEAVRELHRAMSLDPRYVSAHNNLGDTLNTMGRSGEAIEHLHRAIELDDRCFEAHNNLGLALNNLERQGEAVAYLRRSLEINPAYLPAHINLGNALVGTGDVEAGTAHFLRARELKPDFVEAFYSLASTSKYAFDEADIDRMRSLQESGNLSVEQRTLINFALAQALEKCGDYDEAFERAAEANELKNVYYRQRGLAFDPARHRRLVDGIIATCDEDFFQGRAGWGDPSDLPVFIVGMPRSGTSLVEQILATHGRVHGAGELNDIEAAARNLPSALGAGSPYPAGLAGVGNEDAAAFAEKHLDRLRERGGDAARVIDKMTVNFLHLGLVAMLFPGARIIHTRREPRDICVSCFFHNFAQAGLSFAFDLEHIGIFYAQYERIMAYWRNVLPLQVMDVRYEALVDDQEGVSRNMVDFLGLEWDPACLAFHRNPRRVKTASTLQVRRPIYKTSVARHERFAAHLEPFTAQLQPPGDSA